MRARRSSRSASGISIVNGRIVVSSADRLAMTAMVSSLGGDAGEVTARSLLVSSAHRPRREPRVCSRGSLTGLLAEPPSGEDGVGVGVGQCACQLAAGTDVELGEHVVQMPLNGPRTEKESRTDLGIREALTG